MRLGFRPLAAQLEGCRRARSASSLLSLERNRGVTDSPTALGTSPQVTCAQLRGAAPGEGLRGPWPRMRVLGWGSSHSAPRLPRSEAMPSGVILAAHWRGAVLPDSQAPASPKPSPEQLLLVPVQPRPQEPLLPVPGPLVPTVLVGPAVPCGEHAVSPNSGPPARPPRLHGSFPREGLHSQCTCPSQPRLRRLCRKPPSDTPEDHLHLAQVTGCWNNIRKLIT